MIYAYDPEISPKIEPPQSDIEKYLGLCRSGRDHVAKNGVEAHKNNLIKIVAELEAKLAKDNTNPYLWYLKGCSSFSLLYVYKNKSKEYNLYKNLLIKEYEKSLEFNRDKFQLKEYQLRNITASHFLRENSTKQYITLKKRNNRLNKREHLLLLRENIVPSLIKQNKFEETVKTLDYIDAQFPEKAQGNTGNIAWRKHFENEILLQTNSAGHPL